MCRHILANRGLLSFSNDHRCLRVRFRATSRLVCLRNNRTDIIIFQDIFQNGCYELPELDAVHIVDAGANIGLASLYLSIVCPKAEVCSFEPVEYEMCRRNASRVFEIALGSRSGMLNILIDPVNSGGHRLELYDSDPSLQRREVPIRRLDELIDEDKIAAPDFLKIDAEGAECDILEGLGRHVQGVRGMVAEIQSPVNHARMMQMIKAAGFAQVEEHVLNPSASLPGDSYSIITAKR